MKRILFPTVPKNRGIYMFIGLTGNTMSLFLPKEAAQGPPGEPVAVKTCVFGKQPDDRLVLR